MLRRANALIRPIRCDELNLNSPDPWDDDPNPRFDDDRSQHWRGRLDDDSKWPSAAVRQQTPHAGKAPRLNNRIEQMERGQPMPGLANTQTGAMIWYLLRSTAI